MNRRDEDRMATISIVGGKLEISGEITEDSDFGDAASKVEGEVLVDVGNVTRINSAGLREWLGLVWEIEAKGGRVILDRCPPVMIRQINLLENFLGDRGEVRSAYVTYYCGACDLEQTKLWTLDSPPPVVASGGCAGCQGDLDLLETPEGAVRDWRGGAS